MIMRKLYLLFLTVSVVFGLQAQSLTTINVGDDLVQAVMDATDGDTLMLAQGTHVARYTNMDVMKNLTIMGEPGEEMPVLFMGQFDLYADGISFTLADLDIRGSRVDSLTGTELHLDTLEAEYIVNLVSSSLDPTDGAYNTFGDITFMGCMVSHVLKSTIRGDRDSYALSSILVDDCIMHDFRGGSSYGPFRLKSKLTFDSFTAINSTFYDFPFVFLDCEDMISNPTTYQVENCTFYKWGGRNSEGKYLFDLKVNDQATLIIKSCILGKAPQEDGNFVGGFRFLEEATAEISFTAMTPDFLPTSDGYDSVMWDKDEYNAVDLDPMWPDPENGDFSLPEGSDLLQMSPEGTVIGDPRWDPNYGVGIAEREPAKGITLYPNPATSLIHIRLPYEADVSVYSITGQTVLEKHLPAGEQQLPVETLSPGLYFLSTGKQGVIKLIIQ